MLNPQIPGKSDGSRRTSYKTSLGSEETRRKRQNGIVQIRKEKREENLQKKRRDVGSNNQNSGSSYQQKQFAAELLAQRGVLEKMVDQLASPDPNLVLEAAFYFRQLLSIESNPPIRPIIKCGAVPRLIQTLRNFGFPKVQLEAAWSLTNIASGTAEETKFVVDAGVVPAFVELLKSPDQEVREQAVWGLGNIAGDCAALRDLVLNTDALQLMLNHLNTNADLKNIVWALSNLCRGKPEPNFSKVNVLVGVFHKLLYALDSQVLTGACWALSYLSDADNARVQAVVEAGCCTRLVQLLQHSSQAVVLPALRTVRNIASGNDKQTQALIDCGAISGLKMLIREGHRKAIRREALWTLSNITAGDKFQIQAVIDNGIFSDIIPIMAYGEFFLRKQATWTFCNAIAGGTPDQIKHFTSQEGIKQICNMLTCPDPQIIKICLEALDTVLKLGEAERAQSMDNLNVFAAMVEDSDGLAKIEQLQNHENQDVYHKTVTLLETYFAYGDDDDDIIEGHQDLCPAPATPPQGFRF